MFGSLGGPEILFILVLALLIFGPRKLPEIGRAVGRAMSEFRRATYEFRTNLEREVRIQELKETADDAKSGAEEVGSAVRELGSVPREAAPAPKDDAAPASPGAGKTSGA